MTDVVQLSHYPITPASLRSDAGHLPRIRWTTSPESALKSEISAVAREIQLANHTNARLIENGRQFCKVLYAAICLAGVLSLFNHSQFDKLVASRLDVLHRPTRANEASRGSYREIGFENRVLPTVAGGVDVRHVVAGHLKSKLMGLLLANKLPIPIDLPNTVPEK